MSRLLTFTGDLFGAYQKQMEYTRLSQTALTAICRPSFRIVLSRGLLKIRTLKHTLGPIFGPFFAGVVCGASLTRWMVAPYGVIRRWQRVLWRWNPRHVSSYFACELVLPYSPKKQTYVAAV